MLGTSYGGSYTYVFSDFSSGEGDDVHLMRYRQNLSERIRFGVFYQRKNIYTAAKDDYKEVLAADFHAGLDRYYLNAEFAWSEDPSDDYIQQKNDEYSGAKDFLKSNVAMKAEIMGFRIGTAKLGYVMFKPGAWSYGDTYRNDMGDNTSNQYGYWLDTKYLVPSRAITLTMNYSAYQNHVADTAWVTTLEDTMYVTRPKEVYNPGSNLYTEMYIEFVKGFKGKVYFNKEDKEINNRKEKHYDYFMELSVENRLAKLLTQFKIKDIGEDSEVQLTGIEVSVNLTDDWKFFMRGMIANDDEGSRHSIFGEIQYRLSGNTELYLQYGPSWWGQYGLVNDDGFATGGDMQKEVKLILKGWF